MIVFDKLDFAIDESGNLSTVNGDIARESSVLSIQKLIEWRLKTHRNEWRNVNPFIVAGLGDFQGRKNTEATAEEMKIRVGNAITADLLVHPKDLVIDIAPTDAESVNIYITIRNFNALDLDDTSDLNFVYRFDFSGGNILSLTGGTR